MRQSGTPQSDIAIIDWGLPGHEAPYIAGCAKSLASNGHSIEIYLPESCTNLAQYHDLKKQLTNRYDIHFKTFIMPYTSISKRRVGRFLSTFKTLVQVRKKLQNSPKYGVFYTTFSTHFHPYFGSINSMLQLQWGGHVIHPSSNNLCVTPQTIALFGSMMTCNGIGLSDERLVDHTNKKHLSFGKYFEMPDFVNLEFSGLTTKTLQPRVVLIGSLNRYKNILDFLAIARSLPTVNFELIGQLPKSQYTSAELNFIADAVGLPNVKHIDRYVIDGEDFNSYLINSDIVWVAYKHFEHGSNVQIKCNAFRKNCIVSSTGLINHRKKSTDFVHQTNKETTDFLAKLNVTSAYGLDTEYALRQEETFYDGYFKNQLR